MPLSRRATSVLGQMKASSVHFWLCLWRVGNGFMAKNIITRVGSDNSVIPVISDTGNQATWPFWFRSFSLKFDGVGARIWEEQGMLLGLDVITLRG